MRSTLTFLIGSLLIAAPTFGAVKKTLNTQDREFVSACMLAFDQSSSNGSVGVGRQICECTIEESKHQGATATVVKKETAKIKADPKYRIQDPKLLAAFQVCAIEAAKGAEEAP